MKKKCLKTNQNNPEIKAYKEAIERGRNNQHILLKGDKWAVRHATSNEVSQIFNTQKETINFAQSNAYQGTAISVHDSNGLIVDRKYY